MLKKTVKITIDSLEIQKLKTFNEFVFDFYINNELIFSDFNLKNTFIESSYEINFDIEKTNVLKLISPYKNISYKNIEGLELQADIINVTEFIILPNANYIKEINKVYDLLITEKINNLSIEDFNISCNCSQNAQDCSDKSLLKRDYFLNDKLKGTNRICKNIKDNKSEFRELAYPWNYTDKISFKITDSYRFLNSQDKQGSYDTCTLTINVEII
jgi:hypothetical protein